MRKYTKNDLEDIKDSIFKFYNTLKDKLQTYEINTFSIKEFMKLGEEELKKYFRYNFSSFVETLLKIILMALEELNEKVIIKIKKENKIIKNNNLKLESKNNNNLNYKSVYSNFEITENLEIPKVDTFKRLSNFLDKDLIGNKAVIKNKKLKKDLKIKFQLENKGEANKEIKELNEINFFNIKKKYNDVKLLNHVLNKKIDFYKNIINELKVGLDTSLKEVKKENNILNTQLNKTLKEVITLKDIVKQKDFIINENRKKDLEINILSMKLKNINKNFEKQNLKKSNYQEHEIIVLTKEINILKNILDKKLRNDYKRFNLDFNMTKSYNKNTINSYRSKLSKNFVSEFRTKKNNKFNIS